MKATVTQPNVQAAAPDQRLGRMFLTAWAGQTVSSVGSEVSGLGAAIWVFLETGSALWLGLLTAVATLPQVLAAPLMTIVDRVPRRTMMMLGDTFAALGPALLLPLALAGRVEIWQIGVAAFVGGLGTAFQEPAAMAAVPLLVPPAALDRANGLVQLGPAVGLVVGPLAAAPLVAWWGLTAVLLVDLVTCAVAVLTIAAIRFDEPDRSDASGEPADHGWGPARAWLQGPGRPLRTMMVVGAFVNATLALFNVGLLTLATTIGGAKGAGVPIAAVGLTLVLGSLAAGLRSIGPDRIGAFAIGLGTMSAGCVIVALRANLAFVVAGGVVAVVLVPLLNAASASIFQERVPAEIQGRLFGLRGAISGALYPAASALSGGLIVGVAEPLMGGPLAGSLGAVIGSGPERGAALAVLVAGLVLGATGVWLARSPIRPLLRTK